MNHAHVCVHGLIADMDRGHKLKYKAAGDIVPDIRSQMNEWATAAMDIVDDMLISSIYLSNLPSVLAFYAVIKTGFLFYFHSIREFCCL